MVKIPKDVAEAIERIWDGRSSDAVKHLWLTNWDLLRKTNSEEFDILLKFANENPVCYMQALTEGYEVEFDKNLYFNTNGVELMYSNNIVEFDDYKDNNPLAIQIGAGYELLTIGEAKEISDNILNLIQELDKVRSKI